MKVYRAGERCPCGYYLEKNTWESMAVPKPGRVLEGTEDAAYIRLPIPPFLMPLIVTLLGAICVVLFPLIGLSMIMWTAASKLWTIAVAAPNGRPVQSKGDENKPPSR